MKRASSLESSGNNRGQACDFAIRLGANGVARRRVVHHDYDIASRLSALTYDGQSQASNIVYNAASQTLLSNQTVLRGATTLLNLSYDYAGTNGKRTGQLTAILNNLDH